MGDANQLSYLKRLVPAVNGPILEIGSKDYGSTSSYRDFYPGQPYVGIDMEAGKGVDQVVDLTQGVGGLPTGHFALGICCSVLEHVRKPWVFAEHVSTLFRPGGVLYMSVPWVWRYHAYPDDYYRFSWRGIMELFPAFEWAHTCYSTNVPNEFFEIGGENLHIDDGMAVFTKVRGGKRKHLPYLLVNMLGTKK